MLGIEINASRRTPFTKETSQAERNRYKLLVIYVDLDKESFFRGGGLFLFTGDYINLIVCSQTWILFTHTFSMQVSAIFFSKGLYVYFYFTLWATYSLCLVCCFSLFFPSFLPLPPIPPPLPTPSCPPKMPKLVHPCNKVRQHQGTTYSRALEGY